MAIKVKGCTVIDDIKNITAGVSTVTTGCVTGTLTAGTINGGVVCATSCFSGDGSGLSNIPSGAISGLSGGGGVQTFTSPGTFPVPPGTTTLKITSIGGGANGADGALGPFFPAGYFGGPGGAAAAVHVKYLSVPPACSSYPVTVGGAGGDTIFGGPTVFLATGAPDPGAYTKPAQADYVNISGMPTGCYLAFSCLGNGSGSLTPGSPQDCRSGGIGANSYFGKGGDGGDNILNPVVCPACPGCGYGSGGGGGRGGSPGSGGCPGASGAPGFMIVEW